MIAGAGLMATAVLLTVTTLVPMNNRIVKWSNATDVSRALAGRWDRLHWLRLSPLTVMWVVIVLWVTTS